MALPVANVYDAVLELPAYVSLAAALAMVLLVPLYLSQRRDLQRLHAWMDREPEHPAADVAASEALLDRAEAELEAALGVQQAPATAPPTPTTPAEPLPATERASASGPPTSERPALERITMERAALQPHPLWRRFTRRVGQPRVLAGVALSAVVLGIAAIFGSEQLLSGGGESKPGPRPGAVVPADVDVAVLNGTSVPGLAAKVSDDVQVNGFNLGAVTNSRHQFDQTVVMYEPGQQRAAQRVAHDLGVRPVQPIDRQTEEISGGADVVVIAGADRAKP